MKLFFLTAMIFSVTAFGQELCVKPTAGFKAKAVDSNPVTGKIQINTPFYAGPDQARLISSGDNSSTYLCRFFGFKGGKVLSKSTECNTPGPLYFNEDGSYVFAGDPTACYYVIRMMECEQ